MSTNLELLRQIEGDAVSSTVPVTELLRRVQVFATRTRLPQVADWVRYELNGYPPEVELPSYRVVTGVARGHFLGPFGSGLRNAMLPSANLPENLRDWASKAFLRQPISALEAVANTTDREGNPRVDWPGDLIALVQDKFYERMSLAQAWLTLSHSDFIGAVDSVRNRILSFALEAEPLIEEDNSGTPSPATSTGLTQVFHNHIYGNVSNIAQGNESAVQNAGVTPGDLAALLLELRRLGIPQEDVDALAVAVDHDGPIAEKKLGTKVTEWLGKAVSNVASGVWSVTTSTATSIVPKIILSFYGLPSA